MSLSFLYDNSAIQLPVLHKQKSSWFGWFRLRRRKPNSEEEINEIHDLILNVYESMDDQARAVLLSLSKVIQDEDESVTIEEKIQAIISIGHSLCCAHIQVKQSTQLYSKLLVRVLSHQDLRMRLATIIAIGEAAIDNLSFQMKVISADIFHLLNEIGIIPKLFDIMKSAMPYAGYALDDINEHSKLVAWSCYTIVNICANFMPNIMLLKDIVPHELEVLNDAVRLEIWCHVWRENYAQTIIQFAHDESTSDVISNGTQPQSDLLGSLDDRIEQPSDASSSRNDSGASNHMPLSVNYKRCAIL